MVNPKDIAGNEEEEEEEEEASCLIQSQYTETRWSSPRTDLTLLGAWYGHH